MINKIDIITEKISNIQFHIDHVNHAMANPVLYAIPDNKTEVNLSQYLQNLESIKQALETEKQVLTNQG
jgi:Uri superfamily endonuclease